MNFKSWTTIALLVLLLFESALARSILLNRLDKFNGDAADVGPREPNQEVETALPTITRVKRQSDQRRAELETLIALSRMTGRFMTISRGGRHIDPMKIG